MRERFSVVDSHSEFSGLMTTLCLCRHLPGDFGRASFFEVWCVGCAGSDAVGHHLHLILRSPSRSSRSQEVEEHLKQWQLDHTLGWTATSEVLHLLQKVSVTVRLVVWMENSIMLHLWLVSKSSMSCVAMLSRRIVFHVVAVQMDLATDSTWRSAALHTTTPKFSCVLLLCARLARSEETLWLWSSYNAGIILFCTKQIRRCLCMALCQGLSNFVELFERSNVPKFKFLRCAYLLEFCSSNANEGGSIFFSFARISYDSIMHQILPNHLKQWHSRVQIVM